MRMFILLLFVTISQAGCHSDSSQGVPPSQHDAQASVPPVATGTTRAELQSTPAAVASASPSPTAEMSQKDFDAAQESKYALPIPYEKLIDLLQKSVDTVDKVFIHATPVAIANNDLACPLIGSDETMSNWSDSRAWWKIGYLAEAYYAAARMMEGDTFHSELRNKLLSAHAALAQHVIDDANASAFRGLTLNDPITEKTESPLGWNNLGSRWDAFGNKTCSTVSTPNIWASGWSLYTLATSYLLTQSKDTLSGFFRGAFFWHQPVGSPFFKPGYDRYADIVKGLENNGAYAMRAMYTVGGSRLSFDRGDPAKQVLRYHYTLDDPGRFAVNDTALMGLAMIRAGLAYPQGQFDMARTDNLGSWNRPWKDIGNAALMGTYGNIVSENRSYVDLDDVGFKDLTYENHYEFTIYYLAKAGTLLGNSDYVDRAKSSLLKTFQMGFPVSYYGYCLNRQLDASLFDRCKQTFSKFEDSFIGTPEYLFMATERLEF